jgi:hypothetical protein
MKDKSPIKYVPYEGGFENEIVSDIIFDFSALKSLPIIEKELRPTTYYHIAYKVNESILQRKEFIESFNLHALGGFLMFGDLNFQHPIFHSCLDIILSNVLRKFDGSFKVAQGTFFFIDLVLFQIALQ